MSAIQHSIMIFLKEPVEIVNFQTQLENLSNEQQKQKYQFLFRKSNNLDNWLQQYTNQLEIALPNENENLLFNVTFYPQNTTLTDAIDLTSIRKSDIELLEDYLERIIITLNTSLPNCDAVVSFFPEFEEIVDLDLYKVFKKGKLKETKAYLNTTKMINEMKNSA